MSKINTGGPAFPSHGSMGEVTQEGMTLREALAEQPAQQEPVAWHTEDHLTDRSATTYSKDMVYRWECKGWPVTPLYTAPQPQRKPLTEPELHAITPTWPAPGREWGYEEVLAFVRAIERAHGIKE